MPITVNDDNVLRTLGKVSVNDGGVIRNLNTIHTNDGGVLRQIFSASQPVSELNVGDIVKMRSTSSSYYNFIVVHKGKPSSIYDDSCDGVWVVKETPLYPARGWADYTNPTNYYPDSDCYYWGSRMYSMINSAVKPAIKYVKIPYYKANSTSGGYGTVQSGSNGEGCHGFILSGIETHTFANVGDGAGLEYFISSANRICYYAGEAVPWWTRSPTPSSKTYAQYVTATGGGSNSYGGGDVDSKNFRYFRPAFILSYFAGVDKNGFITAA